MKVSAVPEKKTEKCIKNHSATDKHKQNQKKTARASVLFTNTLYVVYIVLYTLSIYTYTFLL